MGSSSKKCGYHSKPLYPVMDTNTRIAVVGGGPSGLSSAFALAKMGYKNVTVLEQDSQVGGMCGSALLEGRVYDLGGQVIAKESSPTIVSLMHEFGVELESIGHHTMSRINCNTGKTEELKIVADCLSLLTTTSKLQAQARETGKLGVHAISSLAHETTSEYLRCHRFERGVPPALAALFIGSGYGYPQDMPYGYFHEFVRSSLGEAWRVKDGYTSFWEKLAKSLPDVRCNVQVQAIQRSKNGIQIKVQVPDSAHNKSTAAANGHHCDQSPGLRREETLQFDKVVISGGISIPKRNRVYRSSPVSSSVPRANDRSITEVLDYTNEELELLSKVEVIDYYTTVVKISGLDIPAMFYYPDHADDPTSMGRFVTMQRFYPDTDIFLFWSYGTAEIQQQRVTELLFEDVERMGGRVEKLLLQKKWRYSPHIRSTEMGAGFYHKLNELQGKNSTYFTGALLAFELTERNSTYSIALMNRCFGSTTEPILVKRLLSYPLPNGAEDILDHRARDLTELPGVTFPDLPSVDAYVSFYASHPVMRNRTVYTWLDNHGQECAKITFAQLDQRASSIGHHLLTDKALSLKCGDRVILLHPPGLEFIEAFLACLRVQIIAVPLIPPNPSKSRGDQALEKLINVAKITDSKAILSTRAYHTAVRASRISLVNKAAVWPVLPWVHTNCLKDNRIVSRSKPASASTEEATPWSLKAFFGNNARESFMASLRSNLSLGSRRSASSFGVGEAKETHLQEGFEGKSQKKEVTTEKLHLLATNSSYLEESDDFYRGDRRTPDPNQVCFLQFTSGSTGDAKGVIITHGALVHNVKSMRAAYRSTSRAVVVSWLPQYHDMGLIGGLLVSLVTGGSLIAFSPLTFIRKPIMWLEAVEKYRATHTAAPNFGFELVLKRYKTLKDTMNPKPLDLSSLRFLMVGAEPICSRTMRAFVEVFSDAGVTERIFAPGFGMAENCVFICCAFGLDRPILVDSDGRVACGYTDRSRGSKGVRSGLERHSSRPADQFVDSCSDVRIVNPDTFEEVEDGVEGEIWLSSPSNGVGYWQMDEATQQTFGVHLRAASAEDAELEFVRSGDLGRVIQGSLFVTGRIKDLIIVNGRNYYPSDIEKTIENCSPLVRPGCSAAFSAPAKMLRSKGVEAESSISNEATIIIVVVVEVRDEKKMVNHVVNQLVAHIKEVVAEEHGLEVALVNLIKPRTIPKTTSGKIRRNECLKRCAEGSLSSIRGLVNLSTARAMKRLLPRRRMTVSPGQLQTQDVPTSTRKSKEEITSFLTHLVADMTGLPLAQISSSESFENYSIDSQGTVKAASKISEFLATSVSAIQIYTAGCISELAEFCDDLMRKTSSSTRGGKVGVGRAPSASEFEALAQQHSVGRAAGPGSGTPLADFGQPLVTRELDYEDHDTKEILEIQLANALEPSHKRQLAIAALQILGMLYIGALLILPGMYIYEKVSLMAFAWDERVARIILLSSCLVPLAWLVYIVVMGLVLYLFGSRLMLSTNHQSRISPIPLWSVSYVRWWTSYRLQSFASNALAGYLRGTVFLPFWYRLLGAEIRTDVHLDTVDITDPTLLCVGSGSVIGEGVTIQSHEVNAGFVSFETVKIGRRCTVGPYAVVQRGTIMDPGTTISALGKTSAGEIRSAKGSPGAALGSQDKPKFSGSIMAVKQLLGIYLVGFVSAVAALVAYASFVYIASRREQIIRDPGLSKAAAGCVNFGYLAFPLLLTFPRYLTLAAPFVMIREPALLIDLLGYIVKERKLTSLVVSFGWAYVTYGITLAILTCALKWSLIGRLKAGPTTIDTSAGHGHTSAYRLWLVHALLRSSHEKFVALLMGTEALCMYLRSLGAQVGKMVSIRRLNAIVDPDVLILNEGCHLGDFSKIITSQHTTGGSNSVGAVSVGAGCVVGAQSVVMPGATLQQRAILGAMSVAPCGAVLEEGGVYIGVKAPVKIFQNLTSAAPVGRTKECKEAEAELAGPGPGSEADEHPLLAGIGHLDKRFRQMIASIAVQFVKETPPGHARYIHYLGAAGKGTMRVLDKLPSGFPKHDMFTPGNTFPVMLRCSNGVSKDDDRCTEVRGGTLRVLKPESPDDLHTPLLDLFMKTGNVFHAKNMVDFVGYYIMTEDERAERIKQFPPLGESQWGNLRKPNSFAEMHYFGCTTRFFEPMPESSSDANNCTLASERMYVKLKIRPADPTFGEEEGSVERTDGLPPLSGMLPAAPDDTRPKSFLRDDFKNKLQSTEGIKFVLQMQLHPIPASAAEQEEVQDPTVVWDPEEFPYVDVAELWLNEHIDDKTFDDIHFNPKHGPRSLAMIPASSAMQVASVDQGRSILHDLLGYMRSGTPLPPSWMELVNKDKSRPAEDAVPSAGCPMMRAGEGRGPANTISPNQQAHRLTQIPRNESKAARISNGKQVNWTWGDGFRMSAMLPDGFRPSSNLTFLRLIQPVLQVMVPIALLILAQYPSLLALGTVGVVGGKRWMYGCLPLAFLFSGLVFALLSIICKWAMSWKIKDGHAQELWSLSTLGHTVWDCINQTLASNFLDLVKGSPLCTRYLQGLGASIKDSTVYIDTLHAMNPDQLKIGARSVVEHDALLFGHFYEGEKVAFKSNFIGDDTVVGTRALVLPGLRMEDGAVLAALGLGMKDEVVRADSY